MRAFVVTGPGVAAVHEVDEPTAGPGDVVVEVSRVGVCGTDVESFGRHVEPVKHSPASTTTKATDERKVQELEREIRDLKITNRAKDMFIEILKNERAEVFEKFLPVNRPIGQLETKLHQADGQKM